MRQMEGYPQQSINRGDRAGCNHIMFAAGFVGFAGHDRNARTQVKLVDGPPQERDPKAAGFDQGHRTVREKGDDDTRKTGTGTDIDPGRSLLWLEPYQLSAVDDVPIPNLTQGRRGDQISLRARFAEKTHK